MSNLTLSTAKQIFELMPVDATKKQMDLNTINLVISRNPEIPIPYFVELCNMAQQTGANLVTKEVMITPRKTKNKVGGFDTVGVVVFSYNFMLRRAQESGQYKGFKVTSGVEDKFDLKFENVENPWRKGEMIQQVLPELSDKGRKVPFCEVQVLREGKEPVSCKVYLDECLDPKSPMWIKNWRLMLEKTALSRATRLQFPEWLGGMYSEEEISEAEQTAVFKIEDENAITTQAVVEKSQSLAVEKLDKDTSKERIEILGHIEGRMKQICDGMSAVEKTDTLQKILGVSSWKELSKKTMEELKNLAGTAQSHLISSEMKKIGSL